MSFIRTSKILFRPNCTNQVKLDELSDFIDLCNNALNFYIVRFIEFYKLDELLFVNAKHKNKKLFSKKHCSNLTQLNNIFYELVESNSEEAVSAIAAVTAEDKNTTTIASIETNVTNVSIEANEPQGYNEANVSSESSKSKFKRKLKFYPDEIIIDYASTSATLPFSLIALSGRTLKSVKTQAMGIIDSWLKEILRSYQFGYFNQDKYKKSHRKKLIKRCDEKCRIVKNLKKGKTKLNIDKFEFNSINCELLRCNVDEKFELSYDSQDSKESNNNFDLLFNLNSMYSKEYIIRKNNKLSIPLRSHKHFNNLKNGVVSHVQCHLEQIVKSILVSKEGIEIRFKFKPLAKESQFKQRKLGIDQGQRKLFTAFSVGIDVAVDKNNVENINDGLYLKETDLNLKTTYNQICTKISKLEKGSKSFKRAQDHRKNIINQAVNILSKTENFNFENDVAEICLEKIRHLGKGKNKSRKLQAFNYADLRYKLERKCQETNVELTETSNAYRSQRCSLCGFVHKKNRLSGGEEFKCLKCGYAADADINSAKNQVANLPELYVFKRYNRNINHTSGFYWLETGIVIST